MFGATGRVGRLVVSDLLTRPEVVNVRCIVRDLKKATEMLPPASQTNRLELVQGNLERDRDIEGYLAGADACVWAAAGFSDASSSIGKALGLLKLKFSPASVIDIKALSKVGSVMASRSGAVDGGPCVVLCSSAGVTRPAWSPEKKAKYVGGFGNKYRRTGMTSI